MTQVSGAPRTRDVRHVADFGFVRGVVKHAGELNLMAYAGGLAYGAVFALVPMLVLLVLLLGVFNATGLVSQAMAQLEGVLPSDAVSLIDRLLTTVAETNDTGSFGVGVVISALVALWGASGAMRRLIEALNVVHRSEDSRSFFGRLAVSVAMALGAIVIIVVTLLVTVLGGGAASTVFQIFGLGETAENVWLVARWPVLLVLAWAGIAAAYRFAPVTRQVGGLLTPGTIFAVVGWVLFSLAFSWYVGGIGNFSAVWGSIAGVIVFLLYLQYAALIVLVGALIDVELFERQRPTRGLRRWLRAPLTQE